MLSVLVCDELFTVMHLATGEAFVNWDKKSLQSLYTQICKEYVKCWDDMSGRAPGIQCGRSMPYLKRGTCLVIFLDDRSCPGLSTNP
jgi:hypothetical protein